MHPADGIRGSRSDLLAGRHVVLGITGSIAAVDSVRIARELIRHGARVTAVMTQAAQGLITADALHFATGSPPITRLTGGVEHVDLFGARGRADLLLICPATANTIGKLVQGIDDTTVTTMATVALGSGKPLVVVPAMHGPMETNPFVARAVRELRDRGVVFLEPLRDEGKLKLPDLPAIIDGCVRALSGGPWAGRKVVVTAGPTREPWDAVREVTNRSSGRFGIALARSAYRAGADVTLLVTEGIETPAHVDTSRFRTHEDLERVLGSSSGDLLIMCAAVADYAPIPEAGKVRSGHRDHVIHLRPLTKLFPSLRSGFSRAVMFKAEPNAASELLIGIASDVGKKRGADRVVVNALDNFGVGSGKAWLVGGEQVLETAGTKEEMAEAIIQALIRDGLLGDPEPDSALDDGETTRV